MHLADPWLVGVVFFVTAVLYSSVGNAGASGYLAVMTLAGMPPAAMKSTALLLNILVALITAVRFYRAGHFSWPPFLAGHGQLSTQLTFYTAVL